MKQFLTPWFYHDMRESKLVKMIALVIGLLFYLWLAGCAAKAPETPDVSTATYELTESADTAQTILTLIRTEPGRDIVVRQMSVKAENDSVLLSLNRYLDNLIVAQDSIRLHTRILLDHYEQAHE